MENRSKIEAGKNSLQPRDECSRLLQVVTFITLPSSSYSRSIFTNIYQYLHVRREISKVKKPPLPLEMVPDLLILRYWMDDRKSALVPLFIAKPSNEFPAALSLLPPARVRLEFKKTVSDFNQVVIEPRFVLYGSKYRAKYRANTR